MKVIDEKMLQEQNKKIDEGIKKYWDTCTASKIADKLNVPKKRVNGRVVVLQNKGSIKKKKTFKNKQKNQPKETIKEADLVSFFQNIQPTKETISTVHKEMLIEVLHKLIV